MDPVKVTVMVCVSPLSVDTVIITVSTGNGPGANPATRLNCTRNVPPWAMATGSSPKAAPSEKRSALNHSLVTASPSFCHSMPVNCPSKVPTLVN